MSFGGFGGFGSNNQQQQSSGFGFGSNNNTTNTGGGFGSSGFGNTTTNTSGGLFGNTSSGFGSGSGGFGTSSTTNASPFGQKPTFGGSTTTSGGLFGSGTGTSTTSGGFGTFGSNTNQTSGFGSTSTGGGLFGASKPAFGSTAGSTGGLFGGSTTTGGFGTSGTTSSAFGQPAASGFGSLTPAQCPGTDSVPFQPVNEKEPGTGGQIQYQTITTMDQYKNWSFEELRVADYLKGKRFGTTNGQAGAFGQSTGFGSGFGGNNTTGGFGTSGTTGGGLFGSSNQQTSSFGQPAGAGFGTGTSGGGLFGANKPATGGLFGSGTTSSQQTSSLFGTSNATTGGFGSGTGTSSFGGTSGGLFGQNNQTQNKGFGFGTGTGSTGFGSGTTAFGQTSTAPTGTGTGLFGQSAATSNPFGGATAQNNTSNPFGGFGNQQNQTQTQPQTGGLFGGFGNNNQQQQQSGGLFGAKPATTGTGLFGQGGAAQTQQTGGLFGGNNQQQQTGGLFGAKPATTGTGLFGGANNTTTNTGGGLFGNLGAQNQQNQGAGLFGQNNQTQNKSLFGSTATGTGGGLFGSLGQNNQQSTGLGGTLFGGNQQNQQSQLGGSLFNSTQQVQQQPTNLFASLDANPYGNDQLFSNLETPSQSIGPIATPLSSSQKTKRNAMLPQPRLNPTASTRLITPQKRPPPGFGFSYSTYGTPGSAISNASPGGGFLGNSFGRSLGKSFSTSNLRGGYDSADSILATGAFSTTPRAGYAAGSLKRLTIDRNVNTRGLFANGDTNGTITPSPLKKSVSFDTTAGPTGVANNTSSSKALVRVNQDDSVTPPPSNHIVNGTTNGTEPSKGKELAVVPEGSSLSAIAKSTSLPDMKDKPVGDYWMKPSLAELRKMSPQQLKKVEGFKVGRQNVGMIEYELPVDLSNIHLEQICGGVVKIGIRNAATYGEDCPVPKPPMGKGLNVRSIITLENSWPRAKAGQLPVHEKKGPRFEKHIQRLKRVPNTEFLDYNGDTGVWKFRVEHYTTYGLDYEGEPEHDYSMDTSVLSEAQDVPTPKHTTPGAMTTTSGAFQEDLTMMSTSSSGLDDTFHFQKQKKQNLPGGFGDESIFEDDQDMELEQDVTLDNTQSFLGERSVGSFSEDGQPAEDEDVFEDESDLAEEQDMAGSFPAPNPTTEPASAKKPSFNASVQPKSILKASVARRSAMDSPTKGALVIEGDWAEQLQRTVSPKKRDRQALRESQGVILKEHDGEMQKLFKATTKDKPITNSIDLMQSLWGKHDGMQSGGKSKKGRKAQELQV